MTLDDIAPPAGGVSSSIVWAPNASRFATVESGILSVYDVKSRKQRTVIALSKLESTREKTITVEEPQTADWTNRRVSEHSIQWFADSRHLLVPAVGAIFVVDADRGTFESLLSAQEKAFDPKLSPDNHYVSYRSGHDLYVVDVRAKTVTRLTSDGTDALLNGELDWVYPEELELSTAHWWSPDSHSVAYLQFDVSKEPLFPQVSLLNPRGVSEPQRYPKAGDPNAKVRLGVVSINGGVTKWMDLGSPDDLLARVVWSPNSREVMAERLNRIQNQLDLLLADITTGKSKTVLHENDRFWINVRNDPEFLGTGDRFLWCSERTGYNHLYIYKTDGSELTQLTSGDWEVDQIAAVDQQNRRVYYTSTEAGPTERQLYSVPFDGSDKKRLTANAGTHRIGYSPDLAFYIDDYSSLTTPTRSVLYSANGREIAVYRDENRAVAEKFDLQPVEAVSLKTTDGTTLFAHLIKPVGFDPGKTYPAIVIIYGGPDEQDVTDSWGGVSWPQALAQKGFVIWQLDNRGSSGRGHAFESAIYHNLGAQELADQREGIRYLISLGFVDPLRIGMQGWSYGGYMTLYTVTHAPGLIKAAIAGGPVTDWRNYDSVYTERYMGLPQDNAAAYRASAPLESASGMDGTKLLILHNIEDDNVHFQNSVQMAAALEAAGKTFFMLVYPGKTHEVTGAPLRQLLDETTKFFEDNLK